MSKPLRVAIIGAGGIARAHARAYAAQPAGTCQLVGYVDIVPGQAEAMAGEFGGRAYADVGRMLSELAPDAVSVCTPPVYHAEYATQALERGISVLCEKPLTGDGLSARGLAEHARRLGVLLVPAHCHRFHGPVQALKELVAAGKLGRLVHFQNRFAFLFAGVRDRWFMRKSVAGGGILLDTAVHSIDLFRHLVGEVAWVSAQVSRSQPGDEVEDSAALLLRSADGALGEIACSWATPPGEATVRLYGSAGAAVLDYSDEHLLRYATLEAAGWVELRDAGPDRFANEVAHFLACVRTGEPPRVTAEDGARAIEIIDAAYRSAELGSGVAL